MESLSTDVSVVVASASPNGPPATPPALPTVQPERDTYLSASSTSVTLDVETTRRLLGEVPAAFHAGVQDVLLIAFGLAWAEFLGTDVPIGIDVEGHGRVDDWADDIDAAIEFLVDKKAGAGQWPHCGPRLFS